MNKKKFGQFFTTNHKYILQNMEIPKNIKTIIEPFAGNGDLLEFIDIKKYNIECYDIEPKKDFIIQRDTLFTPPDYKNKFLLTNPPYLARNKSKDKTLFDKYDVNDLYKCLIKELITNSCLGGIIIIPLNFWSSIRIADIKLRELFLEKYDIITLNIFEERVFEDTSYTICSFQFCTKTSKDVNTTSKDVITGEIQANIYPSNIKIITTLNKNNNFMIGGEIYKLKINKDYKISRLTIYNKESSKENITNILVKCIDDNKDNKINLSFIDDDKIYIDETSNSSARTYATLIIEPKIDKDKQKEIVNNFNKLLEEYRIKYNSLFLANYRESKDIARKRISFDLVYLIVGYLLNF